MRDLIPTLKFVSWHLVSVVGILLFRTGRFTGSKLLLRLAMAFATYAVVVLAFLRRMRRGQGNGTS